jgi:hypothetical protein
MKNLIQEVKNLESQYNRKKQELNEIVKLIKEEIDDSYFKSFADSGTFFRFAIMLIFGFYKKRYEFDFGSKIKINKATEWKTKEYLNYYNILQEEPWKYACTQSYDNVGFVCYKKDLFFPLRNEMENIWKQQVVNFHYTKSLDEFTTFYKEHPEFLFDVFRKTEPTSFLTLVNYPSLELEDIVIYMKQ